MWKLCTPYVNYMNLRGIDILNPLGVNGKIVASGNTYPFGKVLFGISAVLLVGIGVTRFSENNSVKC